MSVWKKELFKWNRFGSLKRDGKDGQEMPAMVPMITIGNVDPANKDLCNLHVAALHGRRKDLLASLADGIWVDFPNDTGQTALFIATLRSQHRTVELLLQNGANPNEKCDTGMTPVHVACMKGSLRALGAMLEAGGDLRLHDISGNSCLDWASHHPSPKKRLRMMEFLQKSQLFALNYSGDYLGGSNTLDRQPSILQMLRGKVSSQMSLDVNQDSGLRRVHSRGYGNVYYGGDAGSGVVSVIPLVTENQLSGDADGVTFQFGNSFVMTSMLWNMTAVTTKTLTRHPQAGSAVDLLISEVEHISKLRHPNLLLLMGLCQASSFDNLMLVFERVHIGSLNHVLHEKMDHLPMTYIRDIACQVCQALLYMHRQSYIHCSLTSHAIFLVNVHQAKVGNLEYMVEMKKASTGRACMVATQPHVEQFYRWMSPEVMLGKPVSAASDIFSFCCILWEMITSEEPWKNKTVAGLQALHRSNGAVLKAPAKSVTLFQEIIEHGLEPAPEDRPANFVQMLEMLQSPLDKSLSWKPSPVDRVKVIQKESKQRIALRPNVLNMFTGVIPSESESHLPYFHKDSSCLLVDDHEENSENTESNSASNIIAAVPSEDRCNSRADSDVTNNYKHVRNVHKGPRSATATDSWSTMDNNSEDNCSLDTVDGKPAEEGTRDDRLHPSRGVDLIRRHQSERSSSASALSRLQKISHRAASLPWRQGPVGILRAGSVSPRLSRATLPPVKPASHRTDTNTFTKGDSSCLQAMDTGARRKTTSLSSRNSLPLSRNRPLHMVNKNATRSQSAVEDMMTTPEAGKRQVGLSTPGSVRTLTEQFQSYMQHHDLRQSILRGSMTPHGTLYEDLDTSPTRLELSPNTQEIPPEGHQQTEAESPEKDLAEGSAKGSNDSLTSVSYRDDSTQDDEDDGVFPLSTGDELDISDRATFSEPYRRCHSLTPNESVTQSRRISVPEKIDFRLAMLPEPEELDTTDGGYRYNDPNKYAMSNAHQPTSPRVGYIGFENVLSFLPASTSGVDVANHPFDFQDYYIDDDYMGLSQHRNPRGSPRNRHGPEGRTAVLAADRSRPRTRGHFWLPNSKKDDPNSRNYLNHQAEDKENEHRQEEHWCTEQTDSRLASRKESHTNGSTSRKAQSTLRKAQHLNQIEKNELVHGKEGRLGNTEEEGTTNKEGSRRQDGTDHREDGHLESEEGCGFIVNLGCTEEDVFRGEEDSCSWNDVAEDRQEGTSYDNDEHETYKKATKAREYTRMAPRNKEEGGSHLLVNRWSEKQWKKEEGGVTNKQRKRDLYLSAPWSEKDRRQKEDKKKNKRKDEQQLAASQWLEERFKKLEKYKREKWRADDPHPGLWLNPNFVKRDKQKENTSKTEKDRGENQARQRQRGISAGHTERRSEKSINHDREEQRVHQNRSPYDSIVEELQSFLHPYTAEEDASSSKRVDSASPTIGNSSSSRRGEDRQEDDEDKRTEMSEGQPRDPEQDFTDGDSQRCRNHRSVADNLEQGTKSKTDPFCENDQGDDAVLAQPRRYGHDPFEARPDDDDQHDDLFPASTQHTLNPVLSSSSYFIKKSSLAGRAVAQRYEHDDPFDAHPDDNDQRDDPLPARSDHSIYPVLSSNSFFSKKSSLSPKNMAPRYGHEDPFAAQPEDDNQGNDHLPASSDHSIYPVLTSRSSDYFSKDSSQTTVVERHDLEELPPDEGTVDDDDNDTTIVAEDVADQRRRLLLNLGKNSPAQEPTVSYAATSLPRSPRSPGSPRSPQRSACSPRSPGSPRSPQRSACSPRSPQRSACRPRSPQRSACSPRSPQRSACSPQRSACSPRSPQRSACSPQRSACSPRSTHSPLSPRNPGSPCGSNPRSPRENPAAASAAAAATGIKQNNSPSPESSSSTLLRKFYLGSLPPGSQGFSSTLRVESSLLTPGSHRITQTARDTGSGLTETVHEETVQADTLRTTMGMQ